ncbi:MAG TPA: universal stress protein [Gemmatimonadaceae bacterium]|jgi:nucleotide-binding universal stress UspA family protein
MYKVIMVPTDGSGFDREAIRVALRMAEKSNAKVRLVRVLESDSFFGTTREAEWTPTSAELGRNERAGALSELYALAAECRNGFNADITVDLHGGPVADVLQGYARRHDVDLIVMSTHGRTGVSRLSLGSVTDSLIRHTSIPVLVVKTPESYLNPQLTHAFKRIVVPLDGSTLAEQVLPRVLALAKLEDAEVSLLQVLIPHSYSQKEMFDPNLPGWDKDVSVAQAYLFRIASRLRRDGLIVTTDIVIGENAADAIGDFTSREKADLIAIATHGRGGLARMVRGSIADAIMHAGKVSMLVLKPDDIARTELSPDVGEDLAAAALVAMLASSSAKQLTASD